MTLIYLPIISMQSGRNANTAVKSWRDWDRDGFKKNVLTPYIQYLQQNYNTAGENIAGSLVGLTDSDVEFTDVIPSSPINLELPVLGTPPPPSSPEPPLSPAPPSQPPTQQKTSRTAKERPKAPTSTHPPKSTSPPRAKRRPRPTAPPQSTSTSTTLPLTPPPQSTSAHPPLAPQVRLPTTLAIYPYLASHLDSLAPETRTIKINQLLKLSVYERQRENNICRNKELLAATHIPLPFTSTELHKAQKKRNEEDTRQKKCSNMNDDFEPDLSDSGSDLDSADASSRVLPFRMSRKAGNAGPSRCPLMQPSATSQDLPNAENIPAHSSPSNLSVAAAETLPSNSMPTSTPFMLSSTGNGQHTSIKLAINPETKAAADIPIEVNTKSWPDWLRTWYEIFSSSSFGDNWTDLVRRWTVLERGYGFKSPIHIYFITS